MAMIPCPSCGLPRDEEHVGSTPCPVCDAPIAAGLLPRGPEAPPPTADPTRDLPADASQLATRQLPTDGYRDTVIGVIAFLGGGLAGVLVLLAWQSTITPAPGDAPRPLAASANPTPAPAREVAVAPPPREAVPRPVEVAAEPPAPDPDPPVAPAEPPGKRVLTLVLNEPDTSYILPSTLRHGRHIVLRGELKSLKISSLEAGAILDASAMKAKSITIGRIEGGATVKLCAPDGVVTVNGSVLTRSVLEINAPGGEVRLYGSKGTKKDGPTIESGSKVMVTAGTVEVRGDVAGDGTRLEVTLTRPGSFRLNAVQGQAVVEYRKLAADDPNPMVSVGPVATTAVFRQAE